MGCGLVGWVPDRPFGVGGVGPCAATGCGFRFCVVVGEAWVGSWLVVLPSAWGGPTRPEQAAAKLNVHPDFDLNLVAAEPLVEKVISLDWAPDGKLWVAETPEYPGDQKLRKLVL